MNIRAPLQRYTSVATPTVSARIHLHPWSRNGDNALACRYCGEQNLHHDRVIVFDRCEDEPKLTKVTVECGVMVETVHSCGSGNPSSRRHGLAIKFWCEHCDKNSELCIAQHKGNTFLSWR